MIYVRMRRVESEHNVEKKTATFTACVTLWLGFI